jgi:hypothetical protein
MPRVSRKKKERTRKGAVDKQAVERQNKSFRAGVCGGDE